MPGFEDAVEFTLTQESGFMTETNGVATNMGIRQDTYDSWMKSRKSATAPVAKITQETAIQIYREWYWEPCGCEGMPYPVAVSVFDFAVNAGGPRSIRFLQKALWLDEDGVIGKETAGAARYADAPRIAYAFLTLRRQYYMKTNNDRYMRGWLNRCEAIWKHIAAIEENIP